MIRSFMYPSAAMIQTVVAVRNEGADIPTQTRERQVANFVGQTLVDLGLYAWMVSHGGMVSQHCYYFCWPSPSNQSKLPATT